MTYFTKLLPVLAILIALGGAIYYVVSNKPPTAAPPPSEQQTASPASKPMAPTGGGYNHPS
jgi:hypothetical protein